MGSRKLISLAIAIAFIMLLVVPIVFRSLPVRVSYSTTRQLVPIPTPSTVERLIAGDPDPSRLSQYLSSDEFEQAGGWESCAYPASGLLMHILISYTDPMRAAEQLGVLLNSGLDVNYPSVPESETLMHFAARRGDEVVIAQLLSFNPDLTAENETGQRATDLLDSLWPHRPELRRLLTQVKEDSD